MGEDVFLDHEVLGIDVDQSASPPARGMRSQKALDLHRLARREFDETAIARSQRGGGDHRLAPQPGRAVGEDVDDPAARVPGAFGDDGGAAFDQNVAARAHADHPARARSPLRRDPRAGMQDEIAAGAQDHPVGGVQRPGNGQARPGHWRAAVQNLRDMPRPGLTRRVECLVQKTLRRGRKADGIRMDRAARTQHHPT